jgi:hypothetical protein
MSISGVSTFTTLSSTNGTITNLTGTAGTITTFNTNNLVPTNINSSGIITAARLGINTTSVTQQFQVGSGSTIVVIDSIGEIGIGTTNPTSKLHVAGNALVTGIVTATTFVGALTGTASSATQLVTPRTFQITGDVVASPISFDGTGNVSFAATIQPNSVGLGTDTTGDYVSNITGTANQITVTGGTGESSTPILSVPSQFTAPQDVTITRDLQINRNLNVNGNITIGGSTATLFTSELKIFDPDIVLGFRTDAFGNDVSNDNTANHGGVALASTEGTPLVQLFIAGIETAPATYKKIMWFKSGTFAGLGTDAWLFNYGVGIGSTQFPTGTRLAAGNVQFTQNDLAVVRNINASGIITATSAIVGSATTINSTGLNVTGIVTATSFVGNGSGLTGAGSTVADDTTTNQTFYPIFTQTTSGTITASKVSTTKLSFNPSTGVLTVVDLNSTSDIKLKENIHTVQNALDVVDNLRGVSFDWKESGRSSYGVIAQELEEVLPELVGDGETKSVNYNGIIGVLIEAIKELKKEVRDLKSDK